MSIKSQATSQWNSMRVHKGKAIGSGVGMTAGVLYGLTNAKGKWGVVGFAIAGTIVGGLVGGMIDTSNASNLVKASEGDSNKSSFRGNRRRKMEVNRPVPRSGRYRRQTGLRH